MFILASMITYYLVLDEGLDLWPLLRLAKEVLLLGQHFQILMTRLLPQTINLYASISIYLSSNYLISSSTAYDPIPIFRPFIPTIAPRNSTLLLLEKKKGGFQFSGNYLSHSYVISFYASIFSTAKRHAPNSLASGMLHHLFLTRPCLPRSTVWWRSYSGKILLGFGRKLSRLLFPSLYILLEDSSYSTFFIFNSQEPVRRALLYFRKLPFLLKFRTSSSLAYLIYTSSPQHLHLLFKWVNSLA